MDTNQVRKLNNDSLRILFINQLNILQNAKAFLSWSLPEIIEHASFLNLKLALKEDLEDTNKQMVHIGLIMQMLNERPSSKGALAMNSIIEEAHKAIKHDQERAFESDMSIIFYMQIIEHCQIGACRILKLISSKSGYEPYTQIIQEVFDEHKDNARLFKLIAQEYVN